MAEVREMNCKSCGQELNVVEHETVMGEDGQRYILTEEYGKLFMNELICYDEYLCCIYSQKGNHDRKEGVGAMESWKTRTNAQRSLPETKKVETHWRKIPIRVKWAVNRSI